MRFLPGICLFLVTSTIHSEEAKPAVKGVVFTEDFESGNLKKWDDYDGNPEPLTKVIEQAGPKGQAGNHVVRLRVAPGERGSTDLVKILDRSYDRLYARWYIYYEPGFNFSASNHGSGLNAGDRNYLGRSGHRPKGDDWFGSWIEHTTDTHRPSAYTYYRGMYQDCADPNGRCWGDIFPAKSKGYTAGKPHHQPRVQPPVLEAGRWYCIEMMLDGGKPTATGEDANGTLNFWVDGVEIGPWTDLWLRTTDELKLSILWLSLFHHDGKHSDEGILIDNVAISTERIGP